MSKDNSEKDRIGAAALAGAVSMALAQIVTQPGDVLKTIVVQDGKGYLDASKKVLRESGGFGMWRGSVPTLLRAAIGGVCFFPALEVMKIFTRPLSKQYNNNGVDAFLSFMEGVGGRAMTEFVTCPLFIVKTEMEYTQAFEKRVSTWGALVNLYGRNGVRGMFTGVVPSIYRSALFSGAYVALVDVNKRLFRPLGLNPVVETMLSAFSAATLGTIFTHPFDVIRTHMQLDATSRLSMLGATEKIVRSRGLIGLQAGIGVKLVKRQISYSMMWPAYEALMRLMGEAEQSASRETNDSR